MVERQAFSFWNVTPLMRRVHFWGGYTMLTSYVETDIFPPIRLHHQDAASFSPFFFSIKSTRPWLRTASWRSVCPTYSCARKQIKHRNSSSAPQFSMEKMMQTYTSLKLTYIYIYIPWVREHFKRKFHHLPTHPFPGDFLKFSGR